MDLNELKSQRESIDAQIATVQKENRSAALTEIKTLMTNFNITIEDLAKGGKTKKASGKVAPKFKHAVTGATWTGRGKTPKWVTDEPQHVVNLTEPKQEA